MGVALHHLLGFPGPLFVAVMDDAQCVNPNVLDLQRAANENCFSKGEWEILEIKALHSSPNVVFRRLDSVN